MQDKFLKINSVLDNTTNSYKIFWFLVILEEIKEKNNFTLEIESLLKRMVDHVWYPLEVYKLSFGKQDSFKKIHELVKNKMNVDVFASSNSPTKQIEEKLDAKTQKHIFSHLKKHIGRDVPFRFLSPFFKDDLNRLIDYEKNAKIKLLSQNSKIAPYYFENNSIVIHPNWKDFFMENMFLLENLINYNLILYLEKNNPNVPSITKKIWKPQFRNLSHQTAAWKLFLDNNSDKMCIYSNNIINQPFSLDHFIPWSVLTHDLNWNLIPTSKEVNSSKSDNLPSLNYYMQKFSNLQFEFFKFQINQSKSKRIIEDYSNEFKMSGSEINSLTREQFQNKLGEVLAPRIDEATNRGFNPNWIFKQNSS